MGLINLETRVIRFDIDDSGVITGVDISLQLGQCEGVLSLLQSAKCGDKFEGRVERKAGSTGVHLLDTLYVNNENHAKRAEKFTKTSENHVRTEDDIKVDLKHLGGDGRMETRLREQLAQQHELDMEEQRKKLQRGRPRAGTRPKLIGDPRFERAFRGKTTKASFEGLLMATKAAAPKPSPAEGKRLLQRAIGKKANQRFAYDGELEALKTRKRRGC